MDSRDTRQRRTGRRRSLERATQPRRRRVQLLLHHACTPFRNTPQTTRPLPKQPPVACGSGFDVRGVYTEAAGNWRRAGGSSTAMVVFVHVYHRECGTRKYRVLSILYPVRGRHSTVCRFDLTNPSIMYGCMRRQDVVAKKETQ